jgi:hypothetical protein
MKIQQSVCKSPNCGAEIYWAVIDTSRKTIPLDVTPTKDGNIIFRDGFAHVVTMFDQVGEHEARFTSHFATCPDAKRWQQKGSGNDRHRSRR